MKSLFTILCLAFCFSTSKAQNIVFSYTVDASIADNIVVDIFARSTSGAETMIGYTTVLYYDSNQADFVSYDETTAQILGWATSGNFTISDISRTNPNVPSTHDSRVELQQFDGNGAGTSFGATSIKVGTLIFDRTVGDPSDGGDLYMGDVSTDPGIVYSDPSGTMGFDIVAEGLRQQALPIELIDFQVYQLDNKNTRLEWITASEINASHFEIERSTDTKSWFSLGQKKAGGNQFRSAEYTFMDNNVKEFLNNHSTIYYRLKMIDLDGAYEYSPVRSLHYDYNSVDPILFPNPATDVLNFTNTEDVQRIRLLDQVGKLIFDQDIADRSMINIGTLPSGPYTIIFVTNTDTTAKTFIKK